MGKLQQQSLGAFLILLMGCACHAQTIEQEDKPHKPIQLPGAFSGFSEVDVLRKIFDGFDRTTSRDSSIPNSENKPTKVSILEAKSWHVVGDEYLVVLSQLAGSSEVLCGNCAMESPLAVLKKDGDNLSLVARQDLPRSYVTDEPVSEIFGTLSYTGHESIALDLAPYRLTDSEMLIGVRIENMWLAAPFYQTRLFLFRVQDGRLRKVWEEPVVDRDYPSADKEGPQIVLKTTSTLSTIASGERFYGLLVKKSTVKCRENEEGDCDSKRSPVKIIKRARELWRFDGEKFNPIPRQPINPVLPRSNPA